MVQVPQLQLVQLFLGLHHLRRLQLLSLSINVQEVQGIFTVFQLLVGQQVTHGLLQELDGHLQQGKDQLLHL